MRNFWIFLFILFFPTIASSQFATVDGDTITHWILVLFVNDTIACDYFFDHDDTALVSWTQELIGNAKNSCGSETEFGKFYDAIFISANSVAVDYLSDSVIFVTKKFVFDTIADGKYVAALQAVDAAGNRSEYGAVFNFAVYSDLIKKVRKGQKIAYFINKEIFRFLLYFSTKNFN